MEEFFITIVMLAFVEGIFAWIDALFCPLYYWLDGAVIEIDEDDLKDYQDNSEYDWGHNVKNYIEEEL